MAYTRKRVALLFCGGTTLDERDRPGDSVRRRSEVAKWMAQMGEMQIVAEVEPHFISGGESGVLGAPGWTQLAQTIGALYRRYDGFFVLHALDTIPYAAAALSFMLQKLGKPVVLTGSPLQSKAERNRTLSSLPVGRYESAGVKANLLNALQVVSSDLAEVSVVFGSRIFRGTQIVRLPPGGPSLFDSYDGKVLGKIDFGTRYFQQYRRRGQPAVRITPKVDANILQIDFQPGLSALRPLDASLRRKVHGIFVTAVQTATFPQQFLASLESLHRQGVPVALYAQRFVDQTPRVPFVKIERMSPLAALVKFMWARGQTSAPARLQKLLDQDLAGEHAA